MDAVVVAGDDRAVTAAVVNGQHRVVAAAVGVEGEGAIGGGHPPRPVSYTPLTLPKLLPVVISLRAVALKQQHNVT